MCALMRLATVIWVASGIAEICAVSCNPEATVSIVSHCPTEKPTLDLTVMFTASPAATVPPETVAGEPTDNPCAPPAFELPKNS